MAIITQLPGSVLRASRFVGSHAAQDPIARRAYSLGASAYSIATGDHNAELRAQINVRRVLPDVWEGANRYDQAYVTPRSPFRTVDVKQLLSHYDVFFIDIFGTYKDETGIWPGAAETLQEMNRLGKPFFLVSNTSDFSIGMTLDQLHSAGVKIGVDQAVFAGSVLRGAFRDLGLQGQRILTIGNEETVEYVRNAGAFPVLREQIGEDYRAILLSMLKENLSPDEVQILIEKASKSGMPIILSNADKFLPLKVGLIENKAYRLAKLIRDNSGSRIILVGKPDQRIYAEAKKRLIGSPKRILCIGDTLWTDVKGAIDFQRANPNIQIDTLLLLSGTERRVDRSPEGLWTFMETENAYPTYILPRL